MKKYARSLEKLVFLPVSVAPDFELTTPSQCTPLGALVLSHSRCAKCPEDAQNFELHDKEFSERFFESKNCLWNRPDAVVPIDKKQGAF
jgi:hypothetical protein